MYATGSLVFYNGTGSSAAPAEELEAYSVALPQKAPLLSAGWACTSRRDSSAGGLLLRPGRSTWPLQWGILLRAYKLRSGQAQLAIQFEDRFILTELINHHWLKHEIPDRSSVRGVGKVLSSTLLAQLPELGMLNRK
jgi:hypothetical protein